MDNLDEKLSLAFRELSKGFLRAAKIFEGKPPKKEKVLDSPMSLQEFFTVCSKSGQRHIRILADWAKEKNPDCRTREQWRQFISRNVKDARDLSDFTDEQIQEGYKKLKEQKYERFNMGTLIKMITK